ncbi:MAG: T9SS type A sorting domain-containing protein [Candidatus Cloacimonadota bacterium]|nr:T9SS type A sorting domain-containing protein [Candidatus Cloacimonadota bacterium]
MDGDTVLVYPGTYYENIDFLGKNIKLGSLYLTTGVDSFIRNTIIDGNQEGSVVKITNSYNNSPILCGFTIENGNGSPSPGPYNYKVGGGIFINQSSCKINSCIIKNNIGYRGGGIYEHGGYTPTLENCTIFNNQAFYQGGGIYCWEITLSQDSLCNVYMNYAGDGCDFYGGYEYAEVFVDTFTVLNPDKFYFSARSDYTFNCQNTKIEPINSDLYVSPQGDNNNSGLTPDDPYKNIYKALIMINSDSTHHNTIHLSPGRYSPFETNEKYPINLRSYVSIMGDNPENTILDADSLSRLCLDRSNEKDVTIKNLTFTNSCPIEFGYGAMMLFQPRGFILNKLIFTNNYAEHKSAISILSTGEILDSTSLYLEDVLIENNYQRAAGLEAKELVLKNVVVKNNLPDYSAEFPTGGGLTLFGIYNPDNYNFYLYNVEITENVNVDNEWSHMPSALRVSKANLNMVNCTIGNNSATSDGEAFKIQEGATVNIYNSILYGDTPREIFVDGTYESCELNVYNSLIEGGMWDIYTVGNNTINWDGNNNLPGDADPCWIGSGEYPYQLLNISPCIDAGTLDLPDGIELPEYDLAGNPRIYGETVDIGAYEWNGYAINEKPEDENPNLILAPNPFCNQTSISFQLTQTGIVNLSIYNIKGQKVKTLIDAFSCPAKFQVNWKGTDRHGYPVANGTYFAKLIIDDKEKVVRKFIKLSD